MPTAGRKQDHLGSDVRHKVDAQLRMIVNGNESVNVARAEYCSSIRIDDDMPLKARPVHRTDTEAEPAVDRAAIKTPRGKQLKLSRRVVASVFLRTGDAVARSDLEKAEITSKQGRLSTAEVVFADLPEVARNPAVRHVELAESLRDPTPAVSPSQFGAPAKTRFALPKEHHGGKDVLIGIIDVGGFDFSHPDFLDQDGVTRWVSIWDQGGDPGRGHDAPKGFDYGVEIGFPAMKAALKNASRARVRPVDLEPQSQMIMGSHGTHVASIAAGNSGICPASKIAGVLIGLPPEELEDRRRFVLDSTRLAHAVDYLTEVARREKCRAVSINISLGTNGGTHDGTSGVCRWIDGVLGEPGRCVTIAAGNAGQEGAAYQGDLGWMTGRIHTAGRVDATGLAVDIEWEVFGDTVADVSENEMQIWYGPQDRFSVSVRPPGPDETWHGPFHAREFVENRQLKSKAFLSVYNDLYHPLNGANSISVFLSPFLGDKKGILGTPAGVWIVRIEGREVKDGRFHAWIERDDPRPVRWWGEKEGWNLPSCFTPRSNVDQCSISSLACTRHAIAVANVDLARWAVHATSSQGPTRDDRQKPDIAAPGTDISAAKGFAGGRDLWIAMTGTSMAAPYVCGVAGLMLACNPELTSSQIQGMMVRTSSPLPGDTHQWNDRSGFGRIDADACIREAVAARKPSDRTGV
jgi:subtilisin family serine protease